MSSQQARPARMGIFLAILLTVFLSIVSLMNFYQTPIVYAATIVVNSVEDIVSDDGLCTLREAITAANTDTVSGAMGGGCPAGDGADVIELAAVIYTLAITGSLEDNNVTGDLDIRSPITLHGEDAETTIIQAGTDGTNGIDRVLHVGSNGSLILEGVTIRYGQALAPAPFPTPGIGRIGGGIYNQGVLTISHSVLYSNTSLINGGGLSTDLATNVYIEQSLVSHNISAVGGGIFHGGGQMEIWNTMILSNTATNEGGGIAKSEPLNLLIRESIFAGNVAMNEGGGVSNHGAAAVGTTVQIEDTMFLDNQAEKGGGLYNEGEDTLLHRVTFAENTAVEGGGIYFFASEGVRILNSTISGNTAQLTGGGIHNDGSEVHLAYVTVSQNSATGAGGGLFSENFEFLSLLSSIVANSLNGGDCALGDTQTAFENLGFNIFEDGSCLNISGADPKLGPLQDNGGPTLTHALLPGSPAIDKNPDCVEPLFRDQRGSVRPQGAGCDAGSYEAGLFTANRTYLPFVVNGLIP